jgi:hypothetical protein
MMHKPKVTDMNTLRTPHHHHHMNTLTQWYTLNPEITTQYLIGYENKNLEITIKKPSGNPKTRTINRSLMFQLMKMQGNNKETHHLGDIYLEVFMSGSFDQASLIKNNLEMKRTFQNEVAMRRLIQTIWSPGLVDIKGGLMGIMYLRISLVLNLP